MIINIALMMIIVKGVDFTLRCALKNLTVTHGHWNTEWAAVFCSCFTPIFPDFIIITFAFSLVYSAVTSQHT